MEKNYEVQAEEEEGTQGDTRRRRGGGRRRASRGRRREEWRRGGRRRRRRMEEEPLGNLTCRRDGRVPMADFCVRMYVLLALLTLSPIWLCMPSNSLVVFLFLLPRVAQDRRGCGDLDFEQIGRAHV